jgi:anti-sigma regulatory factor (Ser/Thr protein kinase)
VTELYDRAVAVPHEHSVTFYDGDDEIVAIVAQYVADGVRDGERVVLAITRAHLLGVDALLPDHGVDPVDARRAGRYVTLDADDLLAGFLVDGLPDPDRFWTSVGRVVAAAAQGSTTRVFGEMVAVLWARGNVAGALDLEQVWNELARDHRFHLLCGYPTSAMDDESLTAVSLVCDLHSAVEAPLRPAARAAVADPGDDCVSRTFVPLMESIAVARSFVRNALTGWGHDAVAWEATVIVSELATNAIRHTESPFRVSVERRSADGLVRLGVEDVGTDIPLGRVAADDDVNGRGMAIVTELAQRWGYETVAGGKRAWADLSVADDAETVRVS